MAEPSLKGFFEDLLSLQETFDATGEMDLPSGPEDRARHIFWMQSLANKYGPNSARFLGALHELQGVVGGDFKETLRDLKTNETALNFAPRDSEGNFMPPNRDDIKKMVRGLGSDEKGRTLAATPLNIFRGQIENPEVQALTQKVLAAAAGQPAPVSISQDQDQRTEAERQLGLMVLQQFAGGQGQSKSSQGSQPSAEKAK